MVASFQSWGEAGEDASACGAIEGEKRFWRFHRGGVVVDWKGGFAGKRSMFN